MKKKRKILANLLETAEVLGVPAKWLKEAANAGKIPCLRVGKNKVLFDPDAVEQSMARLAQGDQHD